jgi:hypothetical protein
MHPRLIPLAIGLLAAALCLAMLLPAGHAADLTWPLRGARALLDGQNPYTDPTIGPGRPYPADAVLYYPLPALLIVLPLSSIPYPLAAAAFAAISVGLLAAVHRQHPAFIGMLCSAPLLTAVAYGQWSPLLTAAAGLPLLGCVLAAKPSIGAALWLARPDRRSFLSIAAIVLISLIVWPQWPLAWLHNVGQGRHVAPMMTLPLLALAALRPEDARCRLILFLALAPQFAGGNYDHLPLFLAMRTRRQGMLLAVASWAGLLIDVAIDAEWLLVASTYGAALAIVLWNRGSRNELGIYNSLIF